MLLGQWAQSDSFKYSDSPGFSLAVRYNYSVDLDGDGLDELIFAGFETQPNTPANYDNTNVAIFGWRNGRFENVTESWLPGDLSRVEGVGDIAMGDFNGDGRIDLYLSAYADMEYQVNGYQLLNTGSSLKKTSLGLSQWEHGAIACDLNQDGFDDVVVFGYLYPIPFFLGGPEGLVKYYASDHWPDTDGWITNGSGGAAGDFYGDGSVSVVTVDNGTISLADTILSRVHNGLSGKPEGFGDQLSLPAPLLGEQSHDVRARSIDFNDDGLLDIVVFSRATWDGKQWPVDSRIQFLQNVGQGVFSDVTSEKLVEYETDTNIAYTPVMRDFNKDGLTDIFLSDSSYASDNRSTALLMQQQDGRFVETGRQLLSMELDDLGGMAGIVYGPGDSFYVVSESHARGGLAEVWLAGVNFPERDQAEFLRGTLGDDMVWGMGGDDSFGSSLGNDFFDGGSGIDTVEIASIFGDVEGIAYGSDGLGVAVTSLYGRDTMISVELVRFLDAEYSPEELMKLLPISKEFSNSTGGISTGLSPTLFSGADYLNLHYQLIDTTPNAIIAGSSLNDFIVLQGGGNKAVDGGLGHDVIDGGTGSTFVSGGGGSNTFFLDGRTTGVSWSTITDFKLDTDTATIWGWKAGVSRVQAIEANGGSAGYTGLTLHFENLLPDGSDSGAVNSNLNSMTFSNLNLQAFGVSSLTELNQQIAWGVNSHFTVGRTVDAYGEHGYLLIS